MGYLFLFLLNIYLRVELEEKNNKDNS